MSRATWRQCIRQAILARREAERIESQKGDARSSIQAHIAHLSTALEARPGHRATLQHRSLAYIGLARCGSPWGPDAESIDRAFSDVEAAYGEDTRTAIVAKASLAAEFGHFVLREGADPSVLYERADMEARRVLARRRIDAPLLAELGEIELRIAASLEADARARHGRLAARCFRKVLRVEPKSSLLWRLLGGAVMATGDMRLAIDAFRRAIALDPDDVAARQAAAAAEILMLEDIDGSARRRAAACSATAVSEAIRRQPDYAPAYRVRSRALCEAGLLEEAFEDSNRAVELSGGDAGSLLDRAIIVHEGIRSGAITDLERIDAAIADAAAAIVVRPCHPRAYEIRARLRLFRSCMGPEHANVTQRLALMHAGVGDVERALELDPVSKALHELLVHYRTWLVVMETAAGRNHKSVFALLKHACAEARRAGLTLREIEAAVGPPASAFPRLEQELFAPMLKELKRNGGFAS